MPVIPRDYNAFEYNEGTYGYELYNVNITDTGTGSPASVAPRQRPPVATQAHPATRLRVKVQESRRSSPQSRPRAF